MNVFAATTVALIGTVPLVGKFETANATNRDPSATTPRLIGGDGRGSLQARASAMFKALDLKPGDSKSASTTIVNVGRSPVRFTLSRADLREIRGPHGGKLSAKLDLLVQEVIDGSPGDTIYAGKLDRMDQRSLGLLASHESRTYRLTLSFPDGGLPRADGLDDNAYQDAAVDVDYVWAGQRAGEPPAPGAG